MKESYQIENIYLSRNPFIRFYCNSYFGLAREWLDQQQEDIVLDFGCGEKWLKRTTQKGKVISYDIDENSEIEDYTKETYTKIFTCHVLEHLKEDELEEVITNFKELNPRKIIVVLPTENWLSKLGGLITCIDSHGTHFLSYKYIMKRLEEEFKLIRKKKVLTMSVVAEFE